MTAVRAAQRRSDAGAWPEVAAAAAGTPCCGRPDSDDDETLVQQKAVDRAKGDERGQEQCEFTVGIHRRGGTGLAVMKMVFS